MSNIVRPSLSFLPVEDIASELRSNKPNRRFMTKDDKATDVEKVGGIDAANIAVSVSPTERTTVENAQKLAGVPAADYLTKTEGEKITNATNSMSDIYSGEIRNLRDEMYQVINQLTKNGFINDYTNYEGFQDAFKKANIKYEGRICGIAKAVIGTTNELYIADLTKKRFFEKDKYFIIKREDLDKEIVVKATDINDAGKITFEPAVNVLDSLDVVGLYKTTGEYIKDSFSFSEIQKDVANPLKERYTMQNDDTRTAFQIINKGATGFAACFKVPNNIAGALTKFSVRAQAEGTPGALICHVLKKEAVYDRDGNFAVSFYNIEDAKAKGYWVATSKPVAAAEAKNESDIEFDFFDVTTNKYPILQGDRYCFIIDCLSASEQDYWKIRFSYYANAYNEAEDLQRYNASYVYRKVDITGLTPTYEALSVIDNIDKYDMIFSVVTREIITEDEVGKQEGVYTAKILLPRPIDVSRARLTMRINREGCYRVKSHNPEYTIFTLEKETSTSHPVSDVRFNDGDTVIIGNVIAKVKRVSGTDLEVYTPAYLDDRMLKFYTRTEFNGDTGKYESVIRIPVYRTNYSPSIKASLVDFNTWDDAKKEYVTTDITPDPIAMDLITILPDGKKDNHRISDRLLYEASFGEEANGVAKIANEFELQVYWKSPFSYTEVNDFKDLNDENTKELIGRIHDLILSFDKNY